MSYYKLVTFALQSTDIAIYTWYSLIINGIAKENAHRGISHETGVHWNGEVAGSLGKQNHQHCLLLLLCFETIEESEITLQKRLLIYWSTQHQLYTFYCAWLIDLSMNNYTGLSVLDLGKYFNKVVKVCIASRARNHVELSLFTGMAFFPL